MLLTSLSLYPPSLRWHFKKTLKFNLEFLIQNVKLHLALASFTSRRRFSISSIYVMFELNWRMIIAATIDISNQFRKVLRCDCDWISKRNGVRGMHTSSSNVDAEMMRMFGAENVLSGERREYLQNAAVTKVNGEHSVFPLWSTTTILYCCAVL